MNTLYRFFDATDALLYVGLTCNPGRRFEQHRDTKAWWADVARVTLEQHPTREALRVAEREAIQQERPRHNIRMNGTSRPARLLEPRPQTHDGPTWEFYDRRGVEVTQARLELYWEVNSDPISDEWTTEEATCYELLHLWWEQYGSSSSEEYDLPSGHVPIYWFVDVKVPNRSTFEGAPFNREDGYSENFLTYFSWPVNEQTGDRLRWCELPVRDKLWDSRHADKGGFIQSALGWKPSALQTSVDIVRVAKSAGISL